MIFVKCALRTLVPAPKYSQCGWTNQCQKECCSRPCSLLTSRHATILRQSRECVRAGPCPCPEHSTLSKLWRTSSGCFSLQKCPFLCRYSELRSPSIICEGSLSTFLPSSWWARVAAVGSAWIIFNSTFPRQASISILNLSASPLSFHSGDPARLNLIQNFRLQTLSNSCA